MTFEQQLALVVRDFAEGLANWRVWMVLAITDIRSRYRRSKIGQFWITISMGITICALAIVYSAIFRINLDAYLPLVAVSFIVWALIASLINDSATVFIEAENYIKNTPLPKSTFIYRIIVRNIVTFGHNVILVPIVMAIFGLSPTIETLIFIPAFFLTLINGIWIAVLLGTVCARYRDLPPIVSNLVQIAFFVSPVMWTRSQLGAEQQYIVQLNPLTAFLELLREPLLGRAPDPHSWLVALGITAFGLVLGFLFFARFRARVSYYT